MDLPSVTLGQGMALLLKTPGQAMAPRPKTPGQGMAPRPKTPGQAMAPWLKMADLGMVARRKMQVPVMGEGMEAAPPMRARSWPFVLRPKACTVVLSVRMGM